MASPLRRDPSSTARPRTTELGLVNPTGDSAASPSGPGPRLRVVHAAELVTDDEHPDFVVLPVYRAR